MRRGLWLLLLIFISTAFLTSCRIRKPREPVLSRVGREEAFVYAPPPPMLTFFWTNEPMNDLVVAVRQTTNINALSQWSLLQTVHGGNLVTIPIQPGPRFFAASIAAEKLTLEWDYPAQFLTPELNFRLYWQPFGTNQWIFATNFPSSAANAPVELKLPFPSGRLAMTVVDNETSLESAYSNILEITNSVGKPVRLFVR